MAMLWVTAALLLCLNRPASCCLLINPLSPYPNPPLTKFEAPLLSHHLFCRQGEGGPTAIWGVIVVIFGRWCYEPQAKYGRSRLDFRGNGNEILTS